MLRFITKKVLILVLSLFFVITVTFFLMQALPGDPFQDEKALPASIHQALRAHYGLDAPWYEQYERYLKAVITFDFGPSFKYKDHTVTQIIREGFPVSALLGVEALLLSMIVGMIAGTFAALKHTQWEDTALMSSTTLVIAVPSFVLAALLQYCFALKLGWFPVARWGSFSHTVLPVVALAAMPTAFLARLLRTNLVKILQQDFIKAARVKGASLSTVVWRHGLPNALVPLLPFLAQLAAGILTGSFVIEKIFGIPGLGHAFVVGVQNRDYTLIMGVTVFYSAILLGFLLLADILYAWVDPRIREKNES